MATKAVVTPQAPTRRDLKQLRRDANRVFIRDTFLQVTGQVVDLVKAQPYLGLAGGYLTVHAMEKVEVLDPVQATALKTLALIVAAAPAGGAGVAAALALGLVSGFSNEEVRQRAIDITKPRRPLDLIDPLAPARRLLGTDIFG